MGTKPVVAVGQTILFQLVGIAAWCWATGKAIRIHGGSGEITASWLGILLIGVVAAAIVGLAGTATKHSAAGLIVVGVIHVVAAAVMILAPVRISGTVNPMFELAGRMRRISQELSDGLMMFTASGTGLILGAVMIGLGIALQPRRQPAAGHSSSGRAIVFGAIAAALGVGVLLASGQAYVQIFMFMQSSPGPALISLLCAAGVAVCFAVMRGARTGGLVLAATMLVCGLFATSPRTIVSIGVPHQLTSAFVTLGSSGAFVMCGVAIAVLCRTARAAEAPMSWYGSAPEGYGAPGTPSGQ